MFKYKRNYLMMVEATKINGLPCTLSAYIVYKTSAVHQELDRSIVSQHPAILNLDYFG